MKSLVWNMHGLIFETSIWLLAGSTRCSHHCWPPCATQCSQKYNSRIQRNLNRMGHTSPDKAPDSAFTDCTQCTTQLLNSPAVRQLNCYSQGFHPHPGLPGTEPLPILTGTGWIGLWLKILKIRPLGTPPHTNSNFLCPSHVGPGVKVKNVTNEIEITFGTPKVYQTWSARKKTQDGAIDFGIGLI